MPNKVSCRAPNSFRLSVPLRSAARQHCRQKVDSPLTDHRFQSGVMVDRFPSVPYSFGALRKVFGPLWVRCDVCRRYARLHLGELRDVDYRTKTFSCSICGADGAMALEEPCKDTGMED